VCLSIYLSIYLSACLCKRDFVNPNFSEYSEAGPSVSFLTIWKLKLEGFWALFSMILSWKRILSKWFSPVFLFDKLDCKCAYRLFGSDGHVSLIFVAMWNLNIACCSAGWSWAAFSQLNAIITSSESQTNKRFMKKQHIHVVNEQTSLRTTAPFFQIQSVWSFVAFKF